ncbi:MAG TPA: 5-(carboxyamino)imidazole ribonucleotide mutase [Nitrososphaeraceae archaeon]|jgi:5-(carboxyamino)imidazole ribonucleotide mutase|nr:5-(carboxyamino)imidazole ribonucleotide mutase [Nitrososphaeraceae archaeon]
MSSPLVGIIMGSESDLPVMKQASETLLLFSVTHEIKIVSAHRTVHRMVSYGENARNRGIEVIIAGAGGAAHLPGMIASLTSLPVIGVPIKTSSLDGLDSLLSIAQMPSGVPVATVAINGSASAAFLACQILSIKHPDICSRLEAYRTDMRNRVISGAERAEKEFSDRTSCSP